MDTKQQERFEEAVERKKAASKAASERPAGQTAHGSDTDGPEQAARIEDGRPQDERSIRDKNAGKGKKTADKWNQ